MKFPAAIFSFLCLKIGFEFFFLRNLVVRAFLGWILIQDIVVDEHLIWI